MMKKLILFILLSHLAVVSLAQEDNSVDSECMSCCEKFYSDSFIDELPVFKENERDLMVYISKNFTYPISETNLNCIKEFKDIRLLTDIYIPSSGIPDLCFYSTRFLGWDGHPAHDVDAGIVIAYKRLIREMSPCKPGKKDGKPVATIWHRPFPEYIYIQKFKDVTDLGIYKNISDIKLLELQEEHIAAIIKLQTIILLTVQKQKHNRSFLQIYVDEEGEVVFAELNSYFDYDSDIQEIFGIIKTMPKFTPYEIDGERVPVKITLPKIEF